MRSILSKDFVIRANRRNYTKRQWRRLWPRILEAARHHNINPYYVSAPYEMVFWFSATGAAIDIGLPPNSIDYANLSSI